MHPEILSANQLNILKKLNFLPSGMYLAGGTALALQLGHRTSLDLDFYTKSHFDGNALLGQFRKKFSRVTISRNLKDTLIVDIEGVSFSAFYYQYDLLKPTSLYTTIQVASVEDIAAMKMTAVSMRGKSRDFIDVYYLLRKFSLKEILAFTLKKYPMYQSMAILKGLIYFEDADSEEDVKRGIRIFDRNFDWQSVKREITSKVEEYQISALKD